MTDQNNCSSRALLEPGHDGAIIAELCETIDNFLDCICYERDEEVIATVTDQAHGLISLLAREGRWTGPNAKVYKEADALLRAGSRSTQDEPKVTA